jgi:uncharacterized alpha-E superfamily protein
VTMLSRVAERVYWMARYIERAEDTARLVAAYNHLVMDIPRGSQPGWEMLCASSMRMRSSTSGSTCATSRTCCAC